jgi:outer membrane protein assembly factor BamB
MKFTILAIALGTRIANAQFEYLQFEYLESPEDKFIQSVPRIGAGCGAYIAPGDEILVVTSSDSQVTGFDAQTGETIFTYFPSDEDLNGNPAFSTSGVSFGMVGGEKYLVTGISYGVQNTGSTFW